MSLCRRLAAIWLTTRATKSTQIEKCTPSCPRQDQFTIKLAPHVGETTNRTHRAYNGVFSKPKASPCLKRMISKKKNANMICLRFSAEHQHQTNLWLSGLCSYDAFGGAVWPPQPLGLANHQTHPRSSRPSWSFELHPTNRQWDRQGWQRLAKACHPWCRASAATEAHHHHLLVLGDLASVPE